MNFLADESVDQPIVQTLRKDGYHVLYIAEMKPGISDSEVLDLANKEKALQITADKDFGELVFRQQRLSEGIILIRLEGLTLQKKVKTVSLGISQHLQELDKSFVVISPGTIRIRKTDIQG